MSRLRGARAGGSSYRRGLLLAGAALAMLLAGCGAVPPGTKAGGGAAPLRVDVVTAEPEGSPTDAGIEWFAASVDRLSGGSLDVVVRHHAYRSMAEPWDPDGHDLVADMVAAGDADIAFTPEWVWSARGAPSLAALGTPFLVDRQSVLEEIATGELAAAMLADLDQHGVRGLALLPDGLRQPLSYGDPILVPADLAGQGFRTLDPRAVDLFEGLGADVRHLDGNVYFSSVARGELRGADASTTTAIVHPTRGALTADVAYFPMTTAVVANDAWFDRLGADQRAILERAARQTSVSIADSAPTPAEAARAYCDAGGTVVLAGAERLATWRTAAAPIRDRLEGDPATATVIAAIDSLVSGSPPEPHPAVPCTAASAARDPDPTEADAPIAFPEGTFRAEIAERAFLNAGIDRQTARGHSGIWTLTFEGGEYEATDPYAPVHDCPGSTYRVEGGRVVVTLGTHGTTCGGAAGQELFSAAWTYDGARLRFTNVRAGDPSLHEFMGVLFGSTPWARID